LLDTQWNAEYSAAEAAWRIERDQACAEHRKPPKINQEKEELTEMIPELNIAEFCNICACKQQLPILPYTYMFYSNTKVDG